MTAWRSCCERSGLGTVPISWVQSGGRGNAFQNRELIGCGVQPGCYAGRSLPPTMPAKAYKGPVAAPAAFSWTGCYIGAHAGYGWGRDRNDFGVAILSGPTEEPSIPSEFGPFDHNTRGGVLGGQAGCNYQFQQNWVVGVEGELACSGIREILPPQRMRVQVTSRTSNPESVGTAILPRVSATLGIGICCTARSVRLGLASAIRKRTTTSPPLTPLHVAADQAPAVWTSPIREIGLLPGVGWEYAFANNWTAKVEYNYVNYGSATIAYPSTSAAIQSFAVHDTVSIVKVGVNYLFH